MTVDHEEITPIPLTEPGPVNAPVVAPAPAPQAIGPPPQTAPRDRDSFAVQCVLWTAIGIYLLIFTSWAWRAGLQIRDDAWTTTRTIRFHGDITNGMRFGGMVLRTAERMANSPPWYTPNAKAPRVYARAAPRPGVASERPLTLMELIHGEDELYKSLVDSRSPDGDFELDYPPLRLMAMTLWTQHVAAEVGGIPEWPQQYRLGQDYNEDIAKPVLMANTLSTAAAAVCGFFLVWIWVNRGGRPNLALERSGWVLWFLPKRRLVPWKPTPLSKLNGLVLFVISASAFFYAVVIAENPTPAPPPSVAVVGRPYMQKAKDGALSAVFTAAIDGQGSDGQWQVEWGKTLFYEGKSSSQGNFAGDDVNATVYSLPANTTIHYRITARNENGITHTPDATMHTSEAIAPPPPGGTVGRVWLSFPQWVGIAILFLGISISLQWLPPIHRGWAAGLVAAGFIWFDPAILMDTHVWPQWDAWVLPPFFLAALLCTLDWWFLAGLVMGVGVMFKGQTLVVGPILVVWPLLAGRFGASIRFAAGAMLSAGLVLSPWLVLNNAPADWSVGALRWIPSVMAAAVVAAALSFYRGSVIRRAMALWNELAAEWNGKAISPAAISPSLGTPGEDGSGGSGEVALTAENPHPNPPPEYRERGREGPEASTTTTSIRELIIFCVSLLIGIISVTVLVLGRWPAGNTFSPLVRVLLLGVILLPPWLLSRRAMPVWFLSILGISIWMSAVLYQGDWAWKTVGFEYGARKHQQMALGQGGMGNLPQIMETRFSWNIDETAMTFHPPDIAHALHLGGRTAAGAVVGIFHDWGLDGTAVSLDIRQLLILIFVLLLLACGLGAALQSRRNDPRILAAFAALWTFMPNILCQMAARYQLWGAAMSALLIAISPGLGLLHIIVAVLAAGMVAAQLLRNYDVSRSPLISDIMARFHPDDGWVMLTIAAVFLYIALAPARRPGREELDLK